jgi:50S ribosome-binding GTPase
MRAGGAPTCGTDLPAVRALLTTVIEAYRDDPVARGLLEEASDRLDGPPRIALVGRVKAGKSTLLNALVGTRLAPTDAGECTRVVTLYRHGAVPRVTLREPAGGWRNLPVRRVDGGLQLDLHGAGPGEVDRLEVDWPAPDLAAATLVDTPGTASLSEGTSARTRSFLDDADRLPGADAVIFLTRQVQADDLAFLAAFQARTGGPGQAPTTITVLSRADEIGAGRLDALVAAKEVAQRVSADPAVREVSATVIPVAGLLALAGRTLRYGDFAALRNLARGPREEVDGMLLTADRFCRRDAPVSVDPAIRATLLDRLGLFGIRFAVALIRAGVDDSQQLADALVARSGLAELQRLVTVHFTARAAELRVGTALRTVEAVLREHPGPAGGELWHRLERLQMAADGPSELAVLSRAWGHDGALSQASREEGERLLGARGTDPAARLGLAADTPDDDVRAAALDAAQRWRSHGEDPLATRATRDAAEVVVRSCEAVLAELDARLASGGRTAEPAAAAPEEQGDQRRHDEAGLDDEGDPVRVPTTRDHVLRQVGGQEGEHSDDQEQPARP